MRTARALAALACLAGLSWAPPSRALDRASLCLVRRGSGAALDPVALDATISIELLKRGLSVERVTAASPSLCPGEAPCAATLVVYDSSLTSTLGGVSSRTALSDLDPEDPARDAAARVASRIAACVRGEPDPIVEAGLALPSSEEPVHREVEVGRPLGFLQAGGRFDWQPGPAVTAGSIEVAGGVSLFDERFVAGLRVGWMPSQPAGSSSFPVKVQSVPLLFFLRGAGHLPYMTLGGAIGGGLEWRQVSIEDRVRPDSDTQSATVPALSAEVEPVFRLPGGFRLSVALGAMLYPGGTTYEVQSVGTAYEAPRWSLATALRVWWVFPEAPAE